MAASPVAVQVTWLGASVILLPSSSVSGVSSFFVATVTVQPGTGMVATEATGWSGSRNMSSLVVDAVSLSVGTRNAIRVYPPWVACVGSIVTWACAAAAKPNTATPTASATVNGPRSLIVSSLLVIG